MAKSTIREQLVNFLIQGRVSEKLDFSISEIEEGLGSLELSSMNREFVEEQIAEYKENGTLKIWEDNSFRFLAKRLSDILDVRIKVENCVLTATSNEELTSMLENIVFQVSPGASRSKILAMSQCFMKDMSVQQEESEIRRKIYTRWIGYIRKMG